MRISVITPSFNQGSFIEDAIQSVLQQNYPDFEHIIVDNCSTDETIGILKKYNHLNWISEPDSGQSDALNKGFARATGDVVCWLNCDDFYLPGTFLTVRSVLDSEQIDGVYSDLQFCDEYKRNLNYYTSNRPSRPLSLFLTYISSETLFFRRKLLEKNIEVDNSLHYCMDQDFVAALLYKNFRLFYVKTCFAVFRWQGQNKSSDSPAVRIHRTKEGILI